MEELRMKNEIDEKLLKYIPKKNQKHIIALYRQCGKISFVMEWEDDFQRSRIADNIEELKEMVETLEEDREAEFQGGDYLKVIYCDCCKRKISDAEKVYSIEIKCGNDKEHILDDVCENCYDRFRNIIDNAEKWNEQSK